MMSGSLWWLARLSLLSSSLARSFLFFADACVFVDHVESFMSMPQAEVPSTHQTTSPKLH